MEERKPAAIIVPVRRALVRRAVLAGLGGGTLAAFVARGPSAAHAQTPQGSDLTRKESDMAKVIFVLQRRADLTREQALAYWGGERHVSVVKQLPGLTRWVQNIVLSAPGEPVCDGIGELWFASDEAMEKALNSPEMAAAVEDAKNFLDMEKTGLLIVEERTIV